MSSGKSSPAYGMIAFFAIILPLAAYFIFASVQGDYGLIHRIQIEAEAAKLKEDRDSLAEDVARLRNKTRRLSDDYLDLDLLDEQAREVLGLLRPDEIVIR